ncbi:OmpA family protein [Alcaligenaceae bacterium]|nr:OmpA family protein [Alcaligenaceae bacterium]
MLALSGQAAKLPSAPITSGLLPAHSGLLPGGSAPDVITPIPAPPDFLIAMLPDTEWELPSYAPDLKNLGLRRNKSMVDPPSYFQAESDPDAVLQHVMGLPATEPVAVLMAAPAVEPEPKSTLESEAEETSLLALMDLPELGDDIEIIRNKESISFRINSEILYGSAKADLSLEGLAALRKLLPVLKSSDYTITVEGHTDALPIRGGQYPSNWELSSARAGRVVRYLATNGVKNSRLRAIGYADTRALASNNTEQGRMSNRRVEIILEQP